MTSELSNSRTSNPRTFPSYLRTMSRWNSYLNTSKEIIEKYEGKIPLSAWLKDFFRLHKQMGSRDRKIISQVVYNFYRLGHSNAFSTLEEKLLTGLFLCNRSSSEMLDYFKPAWNNNINVSLQEKIVGLQQEGVSWQQDSIFPWPQELSKKIDKDPFILSHLQQPDLFLRVRPGQEEITMFKLQDAGIPFTRLNDNCVALPNAIKVDQVLMIDREVIIQDYSSQRVGEFLNLNRDNYGVESFSVWDCCAGSGGKSIMAFDLNPHIGLTVSDSRASIINNLRQRFQRAGIGKYKSYITDLSAPNKDLPPGKFDCIIADVPCSGSGTWSRTPEQLYFFDEQRIRYYSDLQKKIAGQIIQKLNDSGRLIYITCSVFKQENEEVINFIQQNFSFELEKMEILAGYEMKADSMFVAVLKKA